MTLNLDDRSVLFAFSDPGGAKPILSLVKWCKSELRDYNVISDRVYSFFSEFEIEVTNHNLIDLAGVLQNKKYGLIITGTSYTSDFEKEIIELAQQCKIEVWSFIDHWSKMKERFLYNDHFTLPNKVLIIDQEAKIKAESAGIPTEVLHIIGHPYHDFLSNYKPKMSVADFREDYDTLKGDLNILYAPDPLSNVKGENDWIKTDEYEITELLINGLNDINIKQRINLFIKLHPNQNREVFRKRMGKAEANVIMVNDRVLLNDLIYYSNFTISMFSNILKESIVIGTPVIRILTNIIEDPLEDYQANCIIRNQSDFNQKLKQLLKST